MVDDERAALKRQITGAFKAAGESRLEPLGLRRSGRGGRSWFADRGWWQLNVWFDPSGFSLGIYLSVGPQLFWDLSENETMAAGAGWGRQSVKGFGQFASFEGGDGPVGGIADAFTARASEIVQKIDAELGDDWTHLEQLAVLRRSEHGLVNGITAVLLANRLLDRLDLCDQIIVEHQRALANDPNQHQPWSRNASERLRLDDLAQLVSRDDARTLIGDRIDAGRALLRRESMLVRPEFLLRGPTATFKSSASLEHGRADRKWFRFR